MTMEGDVDMMTIQDDLEPCDAEVQVPAFAMLQGENFTYYIRKYSIMLGRNSRKTSVDLDLGSLGGGLTISRHHARITYDFNVRCCALEVLGRKGCLIRDVPFMPGSPLIRLHNQDLIQISKVRFYFLILTRPFFEISKATSQIVPPLSPRLVMVPPASSNDGKMDEEEGDSEDSQGIGNGEGGVSGLIDEFKSMEIENSSSEQSGALDAANNVKNGDGKEGEREESSGEGDVTGMNFEEFSDRVAKDSSGVPSDDMELFWEPSPNEKLEPRSRTENEADNQEVPPVVQFTVNLHGIKKEQIKLEVPHKFWIQIIVEHTIENAKKLDMWHFVQNNGNKSLREYLTLPEDAKIDQIKASMEHGMLTVTVPKGEVGIHGQHGVKYIEISD